MRSQGTLKRYPALTGVLLAGALAAASMLSFASEADPEATHHAASDGTSAHDTHAADHFHRNTAGLFVGLTHAGRRENAPAVGIEYARRFTEKFSLGVVAEYTGGDADLWVAAIPFGLHIDHLKLYIAPGLEDGHHGTEELVRLGAEYAIPLDGGWEVAPQINVDLVDGEDVWVFGLVIARGF